jgi:hypothetical protein
MEEAKLEWLAERTLTLEARTPVVVRLGAPEKMSDTQWRCAFQIAEDEVGPVDYAYGIDAIQALLQSFEGVRTTLDCRNLKHRWQGSEAGDAGFPRFVPQAFGSAFTRMLEAMITVEVERLSLAARCDQRKA